MNEFHPAKRLQGIERSVIRQLFDRAAPGSLNLGLGEPDLPTPDVIREAALRVIAEEQNGYTAHAGLASLRELVAGDYKHLRLAPEGVVITAGSQEAMYVALLTLVDAGDEVLLPDPGFVAYPTIVRMAGGTPGFYRLPASGDFDFDIAEFRRSLSARTKVVVLISPSNPTGRTLSTEQLVKMATALSGTGVYVVSDEIYRDIYYTPEPPRSISEHYARTVVIGGLSKSMSMTGWRLGWLLSAMEGFVRSALVLHGYVTTCASTVSQKAALAAWTTEAAEWRTAMRERFSTRRAFLLARLSDELRLRTVQPDGAFYTMIDVGSYGSSMVVAERLLDHGVITVPGSAFGAESANHLRVSFCAEPSQLAEGVRRIGQALQTLTTSTSVS